MNYITHDHQFFFEHVFQFGDPRTIACLLNINQQLRLFWLENQHRYKKWWTEVIHLESTRDYEVIVYQTGRKLERHLEYHGSNMLKSMTLFENDEKHGAHITYDMLGREILKCNYTNGFLDGPYTKFEEGLVTYNASFKRGCLHGNETEYYKNGNVKVLRTYVNGTPVGFSKTYYADGHLESLVPYADGVYNGEYKEFYPSGLIKRQGWYENNMKQGTFVIYRDEINKIQEIENYENDTLHGEQIKYDKLGRIKCNKVFENDMIVHETRFHRNGTTKLHFAHDGESVGPLAYDV